MRLAAFLWLFLLPAYSFAMGWVGQDLYGVPCQGKGQGFGPYDYNDPQLQKRIPGSPLYLVEIAHFTPHVQELAKGLGSHHSTNANNLDYTLRAFPNHHKALWVMIRFYLNEGRPRFPQSVIPPAECYLQRAIKFRPKDAVLYMLYGIYLHLAGMPEKATSYYEKSLSLDSNLAEAHYNYGLLLVDEKKYKEALKQAKQAYELGYPLPGLRERLKEAGYSLDSKTAKMDEKSADK